MLQTLESVLACLSGAVVALDRAARVVAGNPAFSHLQIQNGVRPATGCEFISLLRSEDHGLFYAALEKAAGKTRAVFAALSRVSCGLDISLTVWRDDYFIVEVIARQAPSPPQSSTESFSDIPLRSIFDSSGTGLALVALDGRWLRANGVICTLLGYSEAQLQATTFMALTHPEDREVGKQLIDELKRGARPGATLHKRYIHRDGRVVWVRLTVGLVRDDQGQPVCFVSQLEDITENWQLRETLMGSELKFLTLAENSPNIIVRYRHQGQVQLTNFVTQHHALIRFDHASDHRTLLTKRLDFLRAQPTKDRRQALIDHLAMRFAQRAQQRRVDLDATQVTDRGHFQQAQHVQGVVENVPVTTLPLPE
jgi:PAS domain S-box-containing protein